MFMVRPLGRFLEVEMRTTGGGNAAQVFWSPDWIYNERDSSVVQLHQTAEEFERIRFSLPAHPTLSLRFDPINAPGEATIRSMRVLDEKGVEVRRLDPMVLTPLLHVESLMPTAEGVRMTTGKDGVDPMLLLRSVWLLPRPTWRSVVFVTPLSLAWVASACVVFVMVAMWLLGRQAFTAGGRARPLLWLTALFLGTVSAKLLLLQHYPAPVPSWDQWPGEALGLYLPFANDGLSWQQMFSLHNEHRIFFSRLLAVLLIAVNGQWDPHLQIVVNAIVHALAAVVFTATLWIAAGRRWMPLWAGALVLILALPFALENTLSGFQSAFYFLTLFSGFAFWGMGFNRPGGAPWLLGWFSAFACLFTVGGGIAIVVGLGTLVLLNALAEPAGWRQALVSLAAIGAVAALGYAGMAGHLPYHDYLKAGSPFAFTLALARNLAFPWINAPRMSVLMWMPLVVLGGLVLYRRLRTTGLERFALAMGVWVAFQAAAIAYSRGANGMAPASRYLDILSFALIANVAGLAAIVDWRSTRTWWTATGAALAAWVLVAGVGTVRLSGDMLRLEAEPKQKYMREYVRNIRRFMVTGDLEEIGGKRGPEEVPHPRPLLLAGLLKHPHMRHILQAAVREPVTLDPSPEARGFAVGSSPEDLFPLWDSYTEARARSRGRIESLPIQCRQYGRLRFELGGAPRAEGVRLYLREPASGREIAVRPRWGAASWNGVAVRCPDAPFNVVAVDDSSTAWFAFKGPTEIASLSAMAESCIHYARVPGAIALALILVTALATVRDKRTLYARPHGTSRLTL